MNYVIQRGKVRQQAINVPEGLPELLSDITREVLRCQPTKGCLCQFIIDYLHSVIVTREKVLVAKSILDRALQQVDSIISDLCICDLSKEKSDLMAKVLEDCFRNFLEKRRCEMRRGKETIKFEDINMFDELLGKCNFSDEELTMSRPAIDSAYKRFVDAYMAVAEGTQGTELLYQYFRDRELKRIEELTRQQAATVIQSAWRGYSVRRALPVKTCFCVCMMENEEDIEAMRLDHAARVIQRFFKTVLIINAGKKMKIDPCVEPQSLPTTVGSEIEAQEIVKVEDALADEAPTADIAIAPAEDTTAEPVEKSVDIIAPAVEDDVEAVEQLSAVEEVIIIEEEPTAPAAEEPQAPEESPALEKSPAPEEPVSLEESAVAEEPAPDVSAE